MRCRLRTADLRAEELRRTEAGSAGFAVDREHRAEGGGAGRAALEHRAAALRALLRDVVLEAFEPALRRAAFEAERDPVAEHLAALLAQPVRRPPHQRFWRVSSPIASAIARRRSSFRS